MVKRAFQIHRFLLTLVGLNTLIILEEFARLYLSHPKFYGLGWYWTAGLSLPSSILWWYIWAQSSHGPGFLDFLCMLSLVFIGGIQWSIVGALLDHFIRHRRSSAKT